MRLVNWEARLSAYIASVARTGFAYGRHDCALFAAGGVDALTGTDPAAAWRGRYTTEIGGLRHLRRAGFRDHIAHAESLFSVMPANSALPGDLGIVENPDGPDRLRTALGIVQGELLYVLRPEGLALLPVNFAVRILGVR